MDKWIEARSYLNKLIEEHLKMGPDGTTRIDLVLMPLKKRLDSGERTETLYEQITSCV